jgi:hypothetical protein
MNKKLNEFDKICLVTNTLIRAIRLEISNRDVLLKSGRTQYTVRMSSDIRAKIKTVESNVAQLENRKQRT